MTCHELRNPLSAILQYSELILDIMDAHENEGSGSLDIDTITEASNTIILCTTHQRRIIDDILVTSKLDSGLVIVEPVDFRPETYLNKSIGMYQADAQAKGVQMSFIVEDSYTNLKIQWLKGDPARVMQVLSNLITNSIKFTAGRETKRLDIRMGATLEEPASCGDVMFEKEDDGSGVASVSGAQWGDGEIVYLTITVVDTGIGIPDDVQKTLFARFQQAPKTETKYGGSGRSFSIIFFPLLSDYRLVGLGLYICKTLVKLLGGSIGVASKDEHGAQFAFYVATRRGTKPDAEVENPGWFAQVTGRMTSSTRTVSRNTASQATSPPLHSPRPRRPSEVTGFKILVVEDNLINQRVLKRQLESRGCTVWTANNGKEAVEFIEKSSLNCDAGPDADEIEICFMVGHPPTQGLLCVADEGRIVKCRS
jgi:signal transduction histidine kinase